MDLSTSTGPPVNGTAQWQSAEIFHSGDEFFARMEEDIAAARVSVLFETYIFEDDEIGARVTRALSAAARRGVRVRMLIDGVGSPAFQRAFRRQLEQAGVEVRIYHPLPWQEKRFGLPRLLQILRFINRRNHRKVCLVDHRIAWVGSLNVSATHVERYSGEKAWRDLGIRVTGPQVFGFAPAFERAWWGRIEWYRRSRRRRWRRMLRKWRAARRNRPRLVRLNDTRHLRRSNFLDFLYRISTANRRIWITNPYFVPNGALVRALRIAAWSGVDVRLLVPKTPDVYFIRWIARSYYNVLLQAGVRIFEYLPTVLHAKSVLIDDWAIVGSSNLNHRSLIHDLEVDVEVTDPDALRSLEDGFERDLTASTECTYDVLRNRKWYERWGGRLLILLRYWM